MVECWKACVSEAHKACAHPVRVATMRGAARMHGIRLRGCGRRLEGSAGGGWGCQGGCAHDA